MKSIFIIAIVAVAMIGVMVPSVFAEEEIHVQIETKKDLYHYGEPIMIKAYVEKIIPNTDWSIQFSHIDKLENKKILERTIPDLRQEIPDENISYHDLSFKFKNELEKHTDTSDLNIFFGNYVVVGFYGILSQTHLNPIEQIESMGTSNPIQLQITSKLNEKAQFILDNMMPTAWDIGTNYQITRTNFYATDSIHSLECTDICYDAYVQQKYKKEPNGYVDTIIYDFKNKSIADKFLKSIQSSGLSFQVEYSGIATLDNTECLGISSNFSEYSIVCSIDNKIIKTYAKKYSSGDGDYGQQVKIFADATLKKIKNTMIEIPSNQSQELITDYQKSEIASFVDQTKDPQHYIDRYNNEPSYKEWFDENYSQYSSIYEAVGLDESFIEPTVTVEPSEIDTDLPICGSGVIGQCQSVQTEEPEDTPEQKDGELICRPGTEPGKTICEVVQTQETSEEGGGCLIATATYGSEMATEVQQLRELRDNQLLQTESGTAFMGTFNDIYYSFSPIIADYERENPYFKEVVKIAITPMITSLSLMENVESESEVLGLGLSVIALNLGMYLGVPAIVVVGIRRKF